MNTIGVNDWVYSCNEHVHVCIQFTLPCRTFWSCCGSDSTRGRGVSGDAGPCLLAMEEGMHVGRARERQSSPTSSCSWGKRCGMPLSGCDRGERHGRPVSSCDWGERHGRPWFSCGNPIMLRITRVFTITLTLTKGATLHFKIKSSSFRDTSSLSWRLFLQCVGRSEIAVGFFWALQCPSTRK